MPSNSPPFRTIRPANERVAESLRTPAPQAPPDDSAKPAVNTPTAASVNEDAALPTPSSWPSEVAQRTSTMWLLPPPSDQASAIAALLRTEIQSHNMTREMLHETEQRRLEAIQRCNQLSSDTQSWATAYNSLTSALYRCSEEFSRLSAENTMLKVQLQEATLNSQPSFQLDATAPKDKQIKLLRRKLSRSLSSHSENGRVCEMRNRDSSSCTTEQESEYSPCSITPE